MQRLITLYLSFFYTGFAPKISGTVASIVSLPLIVLLLPYLPSSGWDRLIAYISITAVLIGFGYAAIRYSKRIPREDVDQSFIVIDEVIGMMIAMLPVVMIEFTWSFALIAFVLFRIFDIAKPLGIGKIDAQNTPFSVILDDVVAGIYSAMILGLILMI